MTALVWTLPDLNRHFGNGIRGAAAIAAVCAAVTAVFTVDYPTRYLRPGTRNLFGIYGLLFGAEMIISHAWRLRTGQTPQRQ
jgi:undecaprenyl pyrophosphate phosphatase UppP